MELEWAILAFVLGLFAGTMVTYLVGNSEAKRDAELWKLLHGVEIEIAEGWKKLAEMYGRWYLEELERNK